MVCFNPCHSQIEFTLLSRECVIRETDHLASSSHAFGTETRPDVSHADD